MGLVLRLRGLDGDTVILAPFGGLTVLEGGLSEDQVHDAVRIAAAMHAAGQALELTSGVSSVRGAGA